MFNPVELYTLATFMHYNPGTLPEASRRTCVGRSYYAAFLYARDSARILESGSKVHSVVIDHYKKRAAKVSNRLKTLIGMRHLADYNMNEPCTARETGKAINLAREILLELGVTEHMDFQPTTPLVLNPKRTEN